MRPIRKLLLRDFLLLTSLVVVVLVALLHVGTRSFLSQQVEARSREHLAHLASTLQNDLTQAEGVARTVARWQGTRLINTRTPDAIELQIAAIMEEVPIVANLLYLTSDGWGISLSRLPDGLRSIHIDARQTTTLRRVLRSAGITQTAAPWETTSFKPHERPWYKLAQTTQEPCWVEAYAFANLPTYGLSYVIPLRDEQGVFLGVICSDVHLASFSEHTWKTQPTPNSKLLVSDRKGRGLLLPRDTMQVVDPQKPAPSLRSLSLDFLPLFHDLMRQWEALKQPTHSMHLDSEGTNYVFTVLPMENLKGIDWLLSLAVPESDYMGANLKVFLLLLLAGIVAAGLAAWRAIHVARTLSEPLAKLAQHAEALGQGHTPDILKTQVRELQTLTRALHQAGVVIEQESALHLKIQHNQRLQTVGTLAGGIAHDVNNQLSAILGQLDLSLELIEKQNPAAAHRIQQAKDAAESCSQMIRSLLGFTHHARPNLRPVELGAILRKSSELLDRVLGGLVRVDLDLDPQPLIIRGEPVQLAQIILNLAVNARDAMPQGGRLLLKTCYSPPDRVLLRIEDTGSGIPKEHLPHIFEPFFTTKEMGKGSGLGLAMVFSIVQSHGGSIDVESHVGRGTCFTLTFPHCEESPREEVGVEINPKDTLNLAGHRILVAEDDPNLRELLGEIFTELRAITDTAIDGTMAWTLFTHGRYDLVITDQRMPGMTGLELLERIRTSGSQVPVILASGYGLEGQEDILEQDPGVLFLAKPFTVKMLLDATKTVMRLP